MPAAGRRSLGAKGLLDHGLSGCFRPRLARFWLVKKQLWLWLIWKSSFFWLGLICTKTFGKTVFPNCKDV